jgi:hypothetical protein
VVDFKLIRQSGNKLVTGGFRLLRRGNAFDRCFTLQWQGNALDRWIHTAAAGIRTFWVGSQHYNEEMYMTFGCTAEGHNIESRFALVWRENVGYDTG